MKLPTSLHIWLKAHLGARIELARLLHVSTRAISRWTTKGCEPWRVNQIKACIELGLLDGGNGHG